MLSLISNLNIFLKYRFFFFFNFLYFFNFYQKFTFFKVELCLIFFFKKQYLNFFFFKKKINLSKYSNVTKLSLLERCSYLFLATYENKKFFKNFKNVINYVLHSVNSNNFFFFFSRDMILANDVLRVNLYFFSFLKSYVLNFFLNKFFLLKNYKFFKIFLKFLLDNKIFNVFFLDSFLNVQKQILLKKNNVNYVSLNFLENNEHFEFSDSHNVIILNFFMKYFFFFYLVDSLLYSIKIKNKKTICCFFK